MEDWLWSDGRTGSRVSNAQFNSMERAYNNMRDRVERMKVLLKNHLLQVKPLTQSLVPLPREKKKRQRAVDDDEEDTILP